MERHPDRFDPYPASEAAYRSLPERSEILQMVVAAVVSSVPARLERCSVCREAVDSLVLAGPCSLAFDAAAGVAEVVVSVVRPDRTRLEAVLSAEVAGRSHSRRSLHHYHTAGLRHILDLHSHRCSHHTRSDCSSPSPGSELGHIRRRSPASEEPVLSGSDG